MGDAGIVGGLGSCDERSNDVNVSKGEDESPSRHWPMTQQSAPWAVPGAEVPVW